MPNNIAYNNKYLIGLIWECNPMYAIITLIEGLIKGCHTTINTLYIFELLNLLEKANEINEIIKIILFYAIYLSIYYILFYWYNQIYDPSAREKIRIAIHKKLFIQAVNVEIKCYDNSEFYNDFVWTMNQAHSQAIAVVQNTGRLLGYIVASLGSFAIMVNIDYAVAILIILLSIGRVILRRLKNKQNLSFRIESNELDRTDSYIKRIFVLQDYAKELRLSRLGEVFLKKLQNNTSQRIKLEKKYCNTRILLDFALRLIDILGNSLCLIIILYKVMVEQSLSIGAFSVTILGLWNMSRTLSGMIDYALKYHETAAFSAKVIEFLNYPLTNKGGIFDVPSFDTIEFCNVSFSYSKDKIVLKNINLKINKGEKIAIVGYNGAGKTTLLKLLMRLYDPDDGVILYNGVDIKKYNIINYRKQISVVFQDYCIFSATIAENVVAGNYNKKDKDKVINALYRSTFLQKLSSYSKGINTMLTKEFDNEGVQLSGGEAQKIAIARAFYNDSALIILDEPSASLDPNSEYLLNKSIISESNNKTIIFISHRLSTTRNADRIYVFENGKIVEFGKHEELMALNGKYSYLFNLQAEKYKIFDN